MPSLHIKTLGCRLNLAESKALSQQKWQKGLISTHQKIALKKSGTSGHTENFAYALFNKIAPMSVIMSAKIITMKGNKLQAKL